MDTTVPEVAALDALLAETEQLLRDLPDTPAVAIAAQAYRLAEQIKAACSAATNAALLRARDSYQISLSEFNGLVGIPLGTVQMRLAQARAAQPQVPRVQHAAGPRVVGGPGPLGLGQWPEVVAAAAGWVRHVRGLLAGLPALPAAEAVRVLHGLETPGIAGPKARHPELTRLIGAAAFEATRGMTYGEVAAAMGLRPEGMKRFLRQFTASLAEDDPRRSRRGMQGLPGRSRGTRKKGA